jgi:hypothetical protein
MLADVWSFLQDENNRTVLAWLGGGIAMLAGGVWTVYQFVYRKKRRKHPTVSARRGGVAAGRDIRDSKIDTGGN